MKEEKDEYELMLTLKNQGDGDPESCFGAAGIDSDSVDVNDGIGIIRWLLKHDPAVKMWKLTRKPAGKQKQYTIRFPPDASDTLEEMAKEEGVPVSEFIRRAVNFYQVKMKAVKENKLLMLQSADGALEIVTGF